MSRPLVAAVCLLFSATTFGQTLFTYGNDTVTVPEFLHAYTKNNTAPANNAKALQEYLNLYMASRLKIKEAYANGYDTLPQLLSDMEGLRQQLIPSYLNDPQSVTRLVDEAFARSQKDIHLAHIFISFTGGNGLRDTAQAWKRAVEVYQKLKNGSPFSDMAKAYSDDPAAKENGGDMGYITVFTLPYELENVVYATPIGKISSIYKSKAGYHIFKNEGERKAVGRIKAAQILLAFPPDATAATKKQLQQLADSLYNRLQKGDDFGKLATRFSNDVMSAAADGVMPEFGVGQYDPVFENIVFALPKDGAISKPFVTPYGYHIVKRIAIVPVNADKANTKALQELRERVTQSDRIQSTQAALAQKVAQLAPYHQEPFDTKVMQAYTDSVLDSKAPAAPLTVQTNTRLFTIGKKPVYASDWIAYAQTFRFRQDGSGVRPFDEVWDEFVQTSLLDYYKDHLETFNADFRRQLAEFKEGNLFFEMMQRKVWGPAQSDTAALEAYYKSHQANYKWAPSADAVLFYANDMATATELNAALKKAPHRWKELLADKSDKVAADSGRFEIKQIPNPAHMALKAGAVTAPLVNKSDNTASFAYIIQLHPQPAQRTFAEAKGLVVNDYQNALEQKWLAELKAKYPVTINEKAFATLLKGK